MSKVKICFCILIIVTFSFICLPADGIAQPSHGKSKPNTQIESMKTKDTLSKRYSDIDPNILIKGNTNIDPKLLIQGNPDIDPSMLINGN